MKNLGRFILLVSFVVFICSCRDRFIKDKNNKNVIEIEKPDKVEVVQLRLNDSMYIRINLDSGVQLRSIVWHNKNSIDGESLVFYPNGRLKKKVTNKDNLRDGHAQYFYESGSIKSDLLYYNGKPSYYGVEYWDYYFSIPKHVYVFGDKGIVSKIRNYDTSGNYLRDSTPLPNLKYPDPISSGY